MSFNKWALTVAAATTLISSLSLASITCVAQTLLAGHVDHVCGKATIPDNTANARVTCENYLITVYNKLENNPQPERSFAIVISAPNGEMAGAHKADVSLIDDNGNGVIVDCAANIE